MSFRSHVSRVLLACFSRCARVFLAFCSRSDRVFAHMGCLLGKCRLFGATKIGRLWRGATFPQKWEGAFSGMWLHTDAQCSTDIPITNVFIIQSIDSLEKKKNYRSIQIILLLIIEIG